MKSTYFEIFHTEIEINGIDADEKSDNDGEDSDSNESDEGMFNK